ncbi:MAG: universal stress protein [Gordonia sp.]|uniref:universal stress protein n=1 Tax=Gordonia sp. (in: high G+C Gram-positive bacteria) TaxID=84139 RepID=UPI001DD05F89|nr:universal stress protein [Gordonia sp. (in: high G+C Gram-positive bacteria)]MCB1293773.1 universal stress protein [Gordonia sp. (in: high G+C Gram-positive bacteria)]
MTIVVGFSASRQSQAPLNLAVQMAAASGHSIVAVAVVEDSGARAGDPFQKEFIGHLTERTETALRKVLDGMPGGAQVPAVVTPGPSTATGLLQVAADHDADAVVVGSSSSGLMGRLALGSVTDRIVHTARLPVAIAPRGYKLDPGRITRVTAGYGGAADESGLIPAAAVLTRKWSLPLRVVSFTVRPMAAFGASATPKSEQEMVDRWVEQTGKAVTSELAEVRTRIDVPDVEVVVGTGPDWSTAMDSVPWRPGEILALGSGAAGIVSQVFPGAAANRILRNSPVPVMLMPKA